MTDAVAPEPEATRLTVDLDADDLEAGLRLMVRRPERRPLLALAGLIVLAIIALLVAFPGSARLLVTRPIYVFLLGMIALAFALLAGILIAAPRLLRRAAERTLAETPGYDHPQTYVLGEDCFGVETIYSRSAYPWNKLWGWAEDERVMIVRLTRQLFFVVPKQQAGAEVLAELRRRLSAIRQR